MTDLQFLNLDSMYSNSPSTPFNATWILSNPLRQVKNIYIKSIELPVNFLNIRSGTNALLFKSKGVNYAITLSPNQYTDIGTLLNEINSLLAFQNFNLQFVMDNGYVTLYPTTSLATSYKFQNTPLLNILGFSKNQLVNVDTSLLPIAANLTYNLNFDNYISLYLQNIPHNANSVNQLCSYKIPLNAVNGVVYFNAENINFSQYITITDKNFVVDKISVVVFDKFGNQLNSTYDYSMTLAFDFY